MIVERILLTPDKAREFLELNRDNRKILPYRVKKYAKDIENGMWRDNGDSIRVSSSGRLLDGQHRCLAVIQADNAIPVLFIHDLPDNVFDSIDRGKSRTNADILRANGEANVASLAAIAKILSTYQETEEGGRKYAHITRSRTDTTTASDILKVVEEWGPSIRWAAIFTAAESRLVSPSFMGSVLTVAHKFNESKAIQFRQKFSQGQPIATPGEPPITLRNFFINKSKKLFSPAQELSLIIYAWNKFQEGYEVHNYRVPKSIPGIYIGDAPVV